MPSVWAVALVMPLNRLNEIEVHMVIFVENNAETVIGLVESRQSQVWPEIEWTVMLAPRPGNFFNQLSDNAFSGFAL